MSVWRINIDIALPDPLPKQILTDRPTAADITWITNRTWLEIIQAAILRLKAQGRVIKPGSPMEEITVKAKYHLCYHDEIPSKPCEAEKDIEVGPMVKAVKAASAEAPKSLLAKIKHIFWG